MPPGTKFVSSPTPPLPLGAALFWRWGRKGTQEFPREHPDDPVGLITCLALLINPVLSCSVPAQGVMCCPSWAVAWQLLALTCW